MEIQGKIIVALEPRSGESKRNPGEMWKSQDFVLETHDQYSRKMMFTVFGADRLARFNIQVGMEALVSFDIDCHEWNGRWFNDIRAYDVHPADPAAMGAAPAGAQPIASAPFAPQAAPATAAPAVDAPFPPAQDGNSTDDLPF